LVLLNYIKNIGDGKFENATESAGIITSRMVGVSFGDYNDDGWPDIWALGWDEKWLYRNNGDGTFSNVTKIVGIDETMGKKGYVPSP